MAIRRRTIMRGSMCPSGDAILLLRAKSLLPRLHGIAIMWLTNADAAMKTAIIAKNRAAFAPRLHQERNFCKRGKVIGRTPKSEVFPRSHCSGSQEISGQQQGKEEFFNDFNRDEEDV